MVEGVLVLGGVVSLPKQLGWRQAIFRGEGGVVGTPFVADELGFKIDEAQNHLLEVTVQRDAVLEQQGH